MPSKRIYKIVFDKENQNYQIQVTDELDAAVKSEYEFEPAGSIEEARILMDDFKKKTLEENKDKEFRSIIYVNSDQFEVINHRD